MIDSSQIEALKKIRALITDIDGVMTDGGIILGTDGQEFKRFDAKDGMGISMTKRAGIKVFILTGRTSQSVAKRGEELKFDGVYQGYMDKMIAYEEIKSEHNLSDEEILHIGDDILDLPIFKKVGFSVSPADGNPLVTDAADYVTERKGGHGAVRETTDLLLKAQGKLNRVISEIASYTVEEEN
ncbi:MAG: HAD hydrolase family protein [Candidatus Marinimicrobia bacterium]|nr:HAD hydrolase family protein [Candidatus Neomarinimicrobiota bacterium]